MKQPSPTQEIEYLSGVNVLRGLLSLTVLLWHYQHFWLSSAEFDYTSQPLFSILRIPYTRGYDAVPVFWMVSGVVLANAYFTVLQKGHLTSYFRARVARLYPLHLITLVVVAALQSLGSAPQIYSNNDIKHFVLNLLFVPWWGFQDGYSFNAPIWSVSVEIPIYLAFALLIYRLRTANRIWIVTAVPAAVLVLSLLGTEFLGWTVIESDFSRCAAYFFTGALVSQLIRINSRPRALAWTAISLGLVVAFGADSGNWLFGTSLVLCILAIAVGPILRVLGSPLFKTFGELTYSVFLWHVPIQICLRWILIETGQGNQYFGSPLLLGGYLIATYLVGYFSFMYVEEPLRRKIRRSNLNFRQ